MKWLIKLCLCLPLLAQAQVLTVKVPSRPVNHLDQEYQLKLLELALTRSGQPFRIQPVELDLNQFTLQQQLSKGKTINVFWMGTSSALESSLIAVPIPLFRGLEGLRLSFIHADAQEKFNQINTLADLKQLKAAQGVGWADNKILENAGIPTYSGRYSSLFRLINDGDKFDFFPRNLVEIFAERSETGGAISQPRHRAASADPLPLRRIFLRQPGIPQAGQGDPDRAGAGLCRRQLHQVLP